MTSKRDASPIDGTVIVGRAVTRNATVFTPLLEPLKHEIVDRRCDSLDVLSVTLSEVALRNQAIDLGASDFQWDATIATAAVPTIETHALGGG